jgi:hypothetical protein
MSAHGNAVVPITANFRSRPAVLNFLNQRFVTPLAHLEVCALAGDNKIVGGPPHVAYLPIPPNADGETDSSRNRRIREADVVAGICEQLIGNITVGQTKGCPLHIPGHFSPSTQQPDARYSLRRAIMYSSSGREALLDHSRSVASMSTRTVDGSSAQNLRAISRASSNGK